MIGFNKELGSVSLHPADLVSHWRRGCGPGAEEPGIPVCTLFMGGLRAPRPPAPGILLGRMGAPLPHTITTAGAEPRGALWRMLPVTPKARLLPSY